MAVRKETMALIKKFVEKYGEGDLLEFLNRSTNEDEYTLTIVADRTMHAIPQEQLIGQIFDFSSGNFDVSSSVEIEQYISHRIKSLIAILKSKSWIRVRIIVSGHAILGMQIKNIVYRILHIDTDDVAYFGKVGYRTISIKPRDEVFS